MKIPAALMRNFLRLAAATRKLMVNYDDCHRKKNPMIVSETEYECTLIFEYILDSFVLAVVGCTPAALSIL